MAKPMFVWLGSGRAKKNNIAADGRMLDQAAKAGLPVPPGAILLDEFYRFARAEGLVQPINRRVYVPDPELLHNTLFYSIRLPRFDETVRFIPLYSHDKPEAYLDDFAGIELNDPADTCRALSAFWSLIAENETSIRRDILITARNHYSQFGLAYHDPENKVDVIQVYSNQSDQRSSLKTNPIITLSPLRRFQMPEKSLESSLRRAQMLLTGARRTLGAGDWQIEWGDDGKICWLLSVIPNEKN